MSRALVIDGERREVLRAIGPVGWVLLEELSLQVDDDGDAVCAVTSSAAQLADATGVGRDAVARALNRLRAAGLLRSESVRDDAGRFACTSYRFERVGHAVLGDRASRVSAANLPVNGEPGTSDDGNGVTTTTRERRRSTNKATPRASTTRDTRDDQLSLLNP